MKKSTKITLIIVSAVLLLHIVIGVLLYLEIKSYGEQYITTNIEDYGNYTGNFDNKAAEGFIKMFFPEKIEESFSDVKYSYRAKKFDTCAFEAYLEFVVTDKEQYKTLCEKYTSKLEGKKFSYAPEFIEYVVIDRIDLESTDKDSSSIRYAEIGKILCCEEEQRIIFVALGVYYGGVATTDFLTVYFNRFNIDPLEYTGDLNDDREKSYIIRDRF